LKNKKTPPLPAVFSGCPERKERRKRNGHPKLMCRPKVQRRENVGGSLKTLGLIKVKRFSSFDESKYNTQKPICQVFCQKYFLVCVFCLFT